MKKLHIKNVGFFMVCYVILDCELRVPGKIIFFYEIRDSLIFKFALVEKVKKIMYRKKNDT